MRSLHVNGTLVSLYHSGDRTVAVIGDHRQHPQFVSGADDLSALTRVVEQLSHARQSAASAA